MTWRKCEDCGAEWRGDESCAYCYIRWESKRENDRKRLLFPEWLDWSERYWRLSEIDKDVWQTTRGIRGDFVTQWQRELGRALIDGIISGADHAGALSRYAKWKMTHSQKRAG